MSQCIECKNIFPADELLHYGEHQVCPGCKGRFLDKLKQGFPAGSGPWRQNRFGAQVIVIPRAGLRFPKRCIKCNAPATKKVARVLRWSPSFRLVARMGDFEQMVKLPLCDGTIKGVSVCTGGEIGSMPDKCWL